MKSFMSMLVILIALAFNNLSAQSSYYFDDEIIAEIKRNYLRDHRHTEIRYCSGNTVIERNERIRKHLVVVNGNLTIYGEVEGSAIAIYGDVVVKSNGYVEEDVISVGGWVKHAKQAWVGGSTLELSPGSLREGKSRASRFRSRGRRSYRGHSGYNPHWFQNYWSTDALDHLILRYNRVEGGYAGLRWPDHHYWRSGFFRLFGEIGYGFDIEKWRYQLGVQISALRDLDFYVGGEYHDFTDTQDSWLLSDTENSANALLLKKDFFDYYRRRGFSLFAVQEISHDFKVKVEYRVDDYSSMPNTTNWSIFRSGQDFRLNPFIDEGEMRSFVFNLNLDSRHSARIPDSGWYMNGSAEFAGKVAGNELGGNFEFDRYVLDIRRYQPLSYSENLDFRIRVGTSRGLVPEQFLFDLGGVSSLPGYNFKEFTGNRMVLFNAEYRTDGEFLFGDILFLDLFHYILFADSGWAWFERDNSSPFHFDDFGFSDLQTDVGFAISNREGDLRLNFAQRLDGGGLNISFRIHRNF